MVGPSISGQALPSRRLIRNRPPIIRQELTSWKAAQPSEGEIRGNWWQVYNDPQLNSWRKQVNISNQNVLAAEAQFREARYAVRIARSALFPIVERRALLRRVTDLG